MIINFSFSNFRSIKDEITLSFEASKTTDLEEYYVVRPTPKLRLLKMAAIYGANASGKSNVVEALDFLRRLILSPAPTKNQKLIYEPFKLQLNATSKASVFKLNFVHDGIRYDYRISFNTNSILSETLYNYAPNRALVFSRSTDQNSQVSEITLGSKVKLSAEDRKTLEANTLWNNAVLAAFTKTNMEFTLLKKVTDWFSNTFQEIVYAHNNLAPFVNEGIRKGSIRKPSVIEILGKADFAISDIVIKKNPNENYPIPSVDFLLNSMAASEMEMLSLRSSAGYVKNTLSFQHEFTFEGKTQYASFSYDEESLGTKRFYQLAGLLDLMIQHQNIFVIDELESSLHPDLLKHYLLLFLKNSKNSQLLFTTHQRDFMRETDMLRNDIFHFTEKGEDGSTDLYSFTDFDSSVIRKGSSLYNAYKIGKLGATPELEDSYLSAG